jgi:hypothetical protein
MNNNGPDYDTAGRIRKRLENSGGDGATHHVQIGTGPTRVHHNIHVHGQQHNHGKPSMGERDSEVGGKGRRG